MKIPNNVLNRLVIGSSSKCNAKCSFCVNENGFDKSIIPLDFNSEEFNRAINNRYTQVTITGGEPFIDNYLECTERCINEFLPISDNVRIFTNGIAVNNIIYILEKYPDIYLTVTIDLYKDNSKISHLIELPSKLLQYKNRITTRVILDSNNCEKIKDDKYLDTVDDIDLIIYPSYNSSFTFIGTQFYDIFKNNDKVKSKFGYITSEDNFITDVMNMNCNNLDKRINFNIRSCFRNCYFKWFDLEDFCSYMTKKLGQYLNPSRDCICQYMSKKLDFYRLLPNYKQLCQKKKFIDDYINKVFNYIIKEDRSKLINIPVAINYLGYFKSIDKFTKDAKYIGNLFNNTHDFSVYSINKINQIRDYYCTVQVDQILLSGRTSDIKELLGNPMKYILNNNILYTKLFRVGISNYL